MPIISNQEDSEKLLHEISGESGLPPEKAAIFYKAAKNVIGADIKKKVIWMVVGLFSLSLIVLWAFLWWIAAEEYSLLRCEPSVVKPPIITERLLLALIAGTVTQISVAFIFMVKYLFSNNETA
jgi:hypothetical protein